MKEENEEIKNLGEISAGFPSEAFNYTEEGIDFNKLLVKQKETTFCLIAGGDSMKGDGIFKGDLLVIDKLEEPQNNSIIVLSVNGEFTLKRIIKKKDHVELISSNEEIKPIIIKKGEELKSWGVLKYVIKKF
jgi:DNA polymerase V